MIEDGKSRLHRPDKINVLYITETLGMDKLILETLQSKKDVAHIIAGAEPPLFPFTPPLVPDEAARQAALHLLAFVDCVYHSEPMRDRGRRVMDEVRRLAVGQRLDLSDDLVQRTMNFLDALSNEEPDA